MFFFFLGKSWKRRFSRKKCEALNIFFVVKPHLKPGSLHFEEEEGKEEEQ
jgi:hypothetical protein